MRILIADRQKKVRFALRVLLERQPGYKVIGEATNAQGLLDQAKGTCPDVVLLSWELSNTKEADLLAALRETCPNLQIIVLSGRLGAAQAALDAGADAFVSKGNPPEKLLAAINGCSCEPEIQGQG